MITATTNMAKNVFLSSKSTFLECRRTFKEGGVKAVVRRYGWRVFAAFFVYYLVRDLTIYVLIPYLIARNFL